MFESTNCKTRSSERIRHQLALKTMGDFYGLPDEILHFILQYSSVPTLMQLVLVSKGWREVVKDWVLRSCSLGCLATVKYISLTPSQLEFRLHDQVTQLGVLCRRLTSNDSLVQRALFALKLLGRVNQVFVARHPNISLTSELVIKFFKASTPLCSGYLRFDRVMVLLLLLYILGIDIDINDDLTELDQHSVSHLRYVLRLYAFGPQCKGRYTTSLKGTLTLWCLPVQARLLYIVYGPRSGADVDWEKFVNPAVLGPISMTSCMHELACALRALERAHGPQYIILLCGHLTQTPGPWRPRYEALLLLMAGVPTSVAVLASTLANRADPYSLPAAQELVAKKIAQLCCFSQIYKETLATWEGFANRPLKMAASFCMTKFLEQLLTALPDGFALEELFRDIVSHTLRLSTHIGGPRFVDATMGQLRLADGMVTSYFGENSCSMQ